MKFYNDRWIGFATATHTAPTWSVFSSPAPEPGSRSTLSAVAPTALAFALPLSAAAASHALAERCWWRRCYYLSAPPGAASAAGLGRRRARVAVAADPWPLGLRAKAG